MSHAEKRNAAAAGCAYMGTLQHCELHATLLGYQLVRHGNISCRPLEMRAEPGCRSEMTWSQGCMYVHGMKAATVTICYCMHVQVQCEAAFVSIRSAPTGLQSTLTLVVHTVHELQCKREQCVYDSTQQLTICSGIIAAVRHGLHNRIPIQMIKGFSRGMVSTFDSSTTTA